MRVVHFPEFQAQGSIPRRSDKNNEPLSVEVSSLPESARIVFVSQRWLSKESPDDENHTKFNMLVTAVMAWINQDEKIDLNEVFIWIGKILSYSQSRNSRHSGDSFASPFCTRPSKCPALPRFFVYRTR